MGIHREKLYKFPWSKTDNPGGWVEVTDECDLFCPGCYRSRIEGHRPLKEIKEDIIACKKITNCDRIGIAGGEPLIYPHIVEVVDFISHHNMKPMMLTNGEKLTYEFAHELKKAGLLRFHIHVDSGQQRPGWTGKNEVELNKLRQHFADLLWELGGIQCAYNITVFPSSLHYLPDIVKWSQTNIHKVHHISFVAFRAIPITDEIEYRVNEKKINPRRFQHITTDLEKIDISTDKMFEILENHFSDYSPCAYLSGTVSPETYKFLVTVNIGSKKKMYGFLGQKSVELVQIIYHLFKGRYLEYLKKPKAGKKLFLLSVFDRKVKQAFLKFLKACVLNPSRFFDRIYLQSISLQQPNELVEGEANLCDGCMNMMMYQGELINSCRLDEYRLFGGPVTAVVSKSKNKTLNEKGLNL